MSAGSRAQDEIDEHGFRQLIIDEDIVKASVDTVELLDKPLRLGVDVAAGGDYNVYKLRRISRHGRKAQTAATIP